jgi:murein DD-endopeptidase MepM/ murein hydrolase activator NlpD
LNGSIPFRAVRPPWRSRARGTVAGARQLRQGFIGPIGNGALKVCPVGQPRAFGDDFGAPRHGGGYHPHAGNDVFAPTGTPICAPFDGYASSSNNALGGLAVIVRGAEGRAYNAHLSAFGKLGTSEPAT